MKVAVEIKKEETEQFVYLPWSNANNNLFCLVYKIGYWKSVFSEEVYKTIIAESMNVWLDTGILKNLNIKITGYLISNNKVYLVLYPAKAITKEIAGVISDLFQDVVQVEIDKHKHIEKKFLRSNDQTKIQAKKLFEQLSHVSEYVVLLITGRKVNIPYYNPHLVRLENYLHNYNFCSAIDYSGAKGPVEVCLLQKYYTPFNYNVGTNYQAPRHSAGAKQIIHEELHFLASYFSLIKTFNCTDESEKDPKINEEQQQVIDFTRSFGQQTLQLIMGANNSALARLDKHKKWVPGLMTHASYAHKWVQSLLKSFGNKESVLKHLGCILLGNEIDTYGPPEPERKLKEYYEQWIPEAFGNLKHSLAESGLHHIPVSVAIKNYDVQNPHMNPVAFYVTEFIYKHWSSLWNNSRPFIFFDHYANDSGKSTDFKIVEHYFNHAQQLLKKHIQVFVGQTGYSSEYGQNKQAEAINQLFRSLYDQYQNYNFKIPVCVFEAFDGHSNVKEKKEMGLFEKGADGNYKLKEGIEIPAWVNEPIIKNSR